MNSTFMKCINYIKHEDIKSRFDILLESKDVSAWQSSINMFLIFP